MRKGRGVAGILIGSGFQKSSGVEEYLAAFAYFWGKDFNRSVYASSSALSIELNSTAYGLCTA